MKERSERAILAGLLSRVRWRILCQTAVAWCVRAGVILLPLAAVVIAADQRWHQGDASLVIEGEEFAGDVVRYTGSQVVFEPRSFEEIAKKFA